GSEDKTVVAPAAGTIAWNGASDTDIACFRLENTISNGNGEQVASIKLGHLKDDASRAVVGQYLEQGEEIGKLCGSTGCPSVGGYAHIHIGVYTTTDCSGTTVPFGTVFGSGYNFSSDGSLYQWHGTEIPAYDPEASVSHDITPPSIVSVQQGKWLGPYVIDHTNDSDTTVAYTAQVYLVRPDETVRYGAARTLSLNPQQSKIFDAYIRVPSNALTGTYTFGAIITYTESGEIDADSFDFTVSSGESALSEFSHDKKSSFTIKRIERKNQ
ncbi:MAG: hypothetical protein D3916_10020, partial [Candidatus Electrothrix sp. MAN1_4]|nr:hypothetical protein [Candidatus Electrothrix sp. MAN1_4]